MTNFTLDPRLKADTKPVAQFDTCELLLMDDARWPWLILVPRIAGAVEWHELTTTQRRAIDDEINVAASALKKLTDCEKVNIASLGNMVRQLHIHIIARKDGDPNWPGPVWGYGERTSYETAYAEQMIHQIQSSLKTETQ